MSANFCNYPSFASDKLAVVHSSCLFGAESYSGQRERKSVWQGFQSKICKLVSGKLSKCLYSSFEKGCRKKVQKCTRQSRKVLWVFSGNSEKMARDTMDVCLRVLRGTNKSRFDSYSVRNVPCFETVFQLKQHFLENCQAEISPATDTTFRLGYYAEGNKKFSISSEIQLAEAFSLIKNGKITLWVDPHKHVPRSSLGRKRKGKENNNPRYLHILLLVRFSTDV